MKNRQTDLPLSNQPARVPWHRRAMAVSGAVLLFASAGLIASAIPAAAAPPAAVTGQACAAGTGVTIAVDYAPGTDEVKISCALGAQPTMADALTAAGVSYSPATGLTTTIGGISVDPTVGFWSIYLNTSDGNPGGPIGTTWSFANTGITGGPLAVDTVLLFDLVPDFTITEDPRISPAEIAATAPIAPPVVSGTACAAGTGVTVAIDSGPVPNEVKIGCATGTQPTMGDAVTSAGFTYHTDGQGLVDTMDGVLVDTTKGFWSFYINTVDGQPTGTLGDTWSFAQTGITGGPLAVDTVLLFDLVPDFTITEDPRISLAEIAATAEPAEPPVTPPGNDIVDPPSYPASADGDALAAAGWIGRQLEANAGVLPGAGGTDWGLTIDAIFALAAAGVGGSDIATAAQAIDQSGSAYIGSVGNSANSAGKIAKTTLALQVAGVDPTVFPDGAGGTRNLPEELRSAMTPDGQFGPNDFPLVHALAVLALDRTSGGVPAPAVTWLQTAQCQAPDPEAGGFGFSGCADVDVDGTSLATQALLAAGVPSTDPSVIAAAAWLSANQQASGALLSSSGGANTNGTGLGGQTFLALGNSAAATSAAGFIGGLQVSCASLVDGSMLTVADVGGIAYDATGWQDANEFGIDSISVDQWRRASTQAILGLGLPAFDSITAAGADPELPAASTCESAVSAAPAPATLVPVAAPAIPAGPQLVNTGVTNATLPMTFAGLAAILVGFGLVLMARRTRGGEHG